MSSINQFKIVNNSNNKGLKFHNGQRVNENISFNNIKAPLSGQTAANNFAANYGGFNQLVTVDFLLFNDGTDKSTDLSNKVTLTEQRRHLFSNVLQGKDASDSFSEVTFTLTTYSDDGTETFTGIVEDCAINGDPGQSGNQLTGSITLYISTN